MACRFPPRRPSSILAVAMATSGRHFESALGRRILQCRNRRGAGGGARDRTTGLHMKAAVKFLLCLAIAMSAFTAGAVAQTPVFEKRAGKVVGTCQRTPKTRVLVCVAVYTREPYLGIQFGSETDPESVAITAGARREPGTAMTIRVDNHAVHNTTHDGFVDYEAVSMLTEIEHGDQITVRFESTDSSVKAADTFDLADLKKVIRAIKEFRNSEPLKKVAK